MPRTVTLEPSPLEVRSMDTPLMRCRASARLVSGNLPMSSATMPSTMPWASRLRFIEEVRLARMPVTTTVSSSLTSVAPLDSWAAACAAGGASAASRAAVSRCLRGERDAWECFMGLPRVDVDGRRQRPTRRIWASCDSVVNKKWLEIGFSWDVALTTSLRCCTAASISVEARKTPEKRRFGTFWRPRTLLVCRGSGKGTRDVLLGSVPVKCGSPLE